MNPSAAPPQTQLDELLDGSQFAPPQNPAIAEMVIRAKLNSENAAAIAQTSAAIVKMEPEHVKVVEVRRDSVFNYPGLILLVLFAIYVCMSQ